MPRNEVVAVLVDVNARLEQILEFTKTPEDVPRAVGSLSTCVRMLAAALAAEVATAVDRREPLASCSECGRPFARVHGNQKYCPTCGDQRATWRRNQTNKRARDRQTPLAKGSEK